MTPPEAPSNVTPKRSPMTLVGERRLPDRPKISPSDSEGMMTVESGGTTPNLTTSPPNFLANQQPPQATFINPEYVHRAAWRAGMMGALNLATAVLSVRLTLLVAVFGASAIAYLSLSDPTPYRLGSLAIYGTLVVLPLVWLASRR